MIDDESPLQYRPFDNDVAQGGAYQYSTGERYSARIATEKLTEITFNALDVRDQRVLDVGCGDGTATFELFRRGKPRSIHGVDLSGQAIAVAKANCPDAAITFERCSGRDLPCPDDSFDVVQFRGVLHHVDQPEKAVAEALRVAPKVFIIEPNGWNPGLKVIEKLSKYHREHGERSFSPRLVESWCTSRGARITYRSFAGFVPFFCPEPLARAMKLVEPIVETVPLLKHVGCAVFAIVAERDAIDRSERHAA